MKSPSGGVRLASNHPRRSSAGARRRFSALTEITLEEVGGEISDSLISSPTTDVIALDCELLRSTLWAVSRDGPAHINRVLSVVVDLAVAYSGVLDETTTRDRFRKTLDELALIGDVVELDGGRWIPSRPRVVDLGQFSRERLIVGGVPTGILPPELQSFIAHRRAFRWCEDDRLRDALSLDTQSVDTWAGIPREPLRVWAQLLLRGDLEKHVPGDGAEPFKLYAPAMRAARAQGFRWTENATGPSGRYLARRGRLHGRHHEYRLIEVNDGEVVASGAVLMPGEARRLMYALDALAGRATEVPTTITADALELVLSSEIPFAERRLFAALGHVRSPDESYYPRTWRFASQFAEEVQRRMRALEVKLVYADGEGT